MAWLVTGWLAHAQQPQQTGLQAIVVLAKAKGTAAGQRVVVVAGERGAEQPEVWRLVVRGPTGTNQLWAFEVRGGRVISERPLAAAAAAEFASSPLVRGKLKVDSPVVFWRAHTEAQKARVGFDTVDYELRNAEFSSAPVWVVRLMNQAGQQVGELAVSAESGQVLRRAWTSAGAPNAPRPGSNTGGSTARSGPPPVADGGVEEKARRAWDGTRAGWDQSKRAVQSGLRKAGGTVGGWLRRSNDGPLVPPPPPADAPPPP